MQELPHPILTLAEDSASESMSPQLLCAVLASAASTCCVLAPSSLSLCLRSVSPVRIGCSPRSLASGAEYLKMICVQTLILIKVLYERHQWQVLAKVVTGSCSDR